MSLRKSETLKRWTLLDTFCLHFWAWLLLYSAITPKNEDKKCPKVFNVSEFHFSEVTFFQNRYFSSLTAPPHQTFQSFPELTSAVSLQKQGPCADTAQFTKRMDLRLDFLAVIINHLHTWIGIFPIYMYILRAKIPYNVWIQFGGKILQKWRWKNVLSWVVF